MVDELEGRVLERVGRFGIMTVDAVECLAGVECVDALHELHRSKFLAKEKLLSKGHYFVPTAKAAKVLHLPRGRAEPLGPQALFRRYAVLCYCAFLPTPVMKLKPQELSKEEPGLATGKDHHDFYLDRGRKRLMQIVVDFGGDYARFVEKARAIVASASVNAKSRIERGGYGVALVVGEEAKQEAVRRLLVSTPMPVWVETAAIPSFGELVLGVQ